MQVNSQTSAGSSTQVNGSGTSASSLTSAADQQDRFMKLLVAQMKNQDPLNPMDNAQMTSQIAQINTVSGIEKLNTTVDSLRASFVSLQAQGAAQLVGRDVLVEGSGLNLVNGAARAGLDLDGSASAVKVEILDSAGRTVQTMNLGPLPAGVKRGAGDEVGIHAGGEIKHPVELGFRRGVKRGRQASGSGDPGKRSLGGEFVGRRPRIVADGGCWNESSAEGLE